MITRFKKQLVAAALLTSAFGVLSVNAQEPVTLRVWTIQFGSDANEANEAIVAAYEAANPGVDVQVEVRQGDAHSSALRLAMNTEAAPDIFFMWGGLGQAGFFVNSGGVEPLDQYYEQYGWEDRFDAASLGAGVLNDQYYGIPFAFHAMGLWYRKDVFEASGITAEPTTYEELVAANEAMAAAGYTPLYTAGRFGWMPMRLVDSLLELKCGAELHDQLRSMEANWADETCVTDAYTEYRRWVTEGWLPDNFLGVSPDEPAVPFYTGQAGMLYDGDWQLKGFPASEQDMSNIDFFNFPTGTGRISFFNELYFITSTSPNKDAAAAFLDYWTSAEVQGAYPGIWGAFSPTLGASPDPGDDALVAEWQMVVETAPGGYLPADQALAQDVLTTYFRMNDEVVSGVTEPSAVGAIIQEAIDAYLASNS
jgi:raffinose/stachyose/melibiose transport system substrate-binding protein